MSVPGEAVAGRSSSWPEAGSGGSVGGLTGSPEAPCGDLGPATEPEARISPQSYQSSRAEPWHTVPEAFTGGPERSVGINICSPLSVLASAQAS